MTVQGPSRPPLPPDYPTVRAEQVLGPQTAKRLAAFRNGVLYVKARESRQFLAWLVDFVVFLLGAAIGIIVVGGVGNAADLDNGKLALGMIGVLFLVPLLYGAWYGNGRALGGVLTGTQLVRLKDGGRIGAKAPWAMLVRTLLFPVLVILLLLAALSGGGAVGGDSGPRVSVDADATRQLRAAGIT